MTEPKQKAEELINKFEDNLSYGCTHNAKQCAIICVEEIIEALKNPSTQKNAVLVLKKELEYWKEVLNQIKQL